MGTDCSIDRDEKDYNKYVLAACITDIEQKRLI